MQGYLPHVLCLSLSPSLFLTLSLSLFVGPNVQLLSLANPRCLVGGGGRGCYYQAGAYSSGRCVWAKKLIILYYTPTTPSQCSPSRSSLLSRHRALIWLVNLACMQSG